MRRRRRNLNSYPKKMEVEKEDKSFLTDAGIILAFLTGLGYLIAFSYKSGYKGYYGLHEMFLSDVKIIDILIAMTAISSVVTFGYAILQIFSEIKPNDSENPVFIAFKYKFAPTAIILIILAFVLINVSKVSIYICVYLLVMIIWIFFLNPIVLIKNEIGYKNRMKKYVQDVDKTPFLDKVKSVFRWNKPAFIVSVFLLSNSAAGLTNLYGYKQAKMEHDYTIVYHKNKDYVVIDNNDGNFTLAPVNIKEETIRSEFIIVEGKSEFSKPLVFKPHYFKKGLKVD